MGHSRHRGYIALAAACLLAAALVAAPSPATASPSALAAAQADLAAAEAAAAAAGTRALEAAAAAARAREEADAAAAAHAELSDQVRAAEETAERERLRFATVAGEWYRSSRTAPVLAQVLTSAEPDDLLFRLGLLDRVTDSSARSAAVARESAAVVTGLREQARTAADEHAVRAAEAEAAALAAHRAAGAESVAVADARREVDAAYARLAAARGTTPAREKQTRQHERAAADAAAPGGAGGGAPSAPAPALDIPSGAPAMTPAQAQAHARGAVTARGWDDAQFACLVSLWTRESGWRWDALNRSSGAYGIPQSLPASKMASAGADWRTNAATQIAWGLSYIAGRYGTPCAAWEHSERRGWY